MDKEKLQDKLKSLKGKEYLDKIKSVDGKEILDKIKSVDAKELLEKAKSIDTKEYLDKIKSVDGKEILDKIKSVDAKELLDKAKSVDAKELFEKAKSVDAKELLEKAKSVDGKELLGKAKSLNPKKKKMILIGVLCLLCVAGGVRWLTKSDSVSVQSGSSKKSSASKKTDPRKANAIRKAKVKLDLPPQSEEYKQGEELREQRKHAEANKLYEAGVEKGDPWCMGALGMYYYQLGSRYLPNRRLSHEYAAELLSKAAEQNIPFANYLLGDAYLKGIQNLHLGQDTAKGLELLTKAAELNDLKALSDLSRYYLNGENDVPKDTDKGIELLMLAAELGSSGANARLGGYYEKGEYGLEKDPETALSYYKKAQELGDHGSNTNQKISSLEYQIKHQRILEKVEAATKTKVVGTEVFLLEYSQNEIAANKKYKGKKVCIEGTVAELGQTDNGGACVVFYKNRVADQYMAITGMLTEALTGSTGGMKIDLDAVVFYFDKKYVDDAAALNKGERVIIMGEPKGRSIINLLDVVELQHCRVPRVD